MLPNTLATKDAALDEAVKGIDVVTVESFVRLRDRLSEGAKLLGGHVAFSVFFAYVNPTWSGSIASTKAAIAADDQALDAARTYISQQAQLTEEKSSIDQASLARLSIFLPDAVDNVGLILYLNTLAARSGVSLSNIDVIKGGKSGTRGSATTDEIGSLPVSGISPVDSVDLSLSAVGTYSA